MKCMLGILAICSVALLLGPGRTLDVIELVGGVPNCTVSSQYTPPPDHCDGPVECRIPDMYDYIATWSDSEDKIVAATTYCAGILDEEGHPCDGSAIDETLVGGCILN